MNILEDIFRKYLFKWRHRRCLKGLFEADRFLKWSLDEYIYGGINIFKFIFSYLKEMSGKI